MNIAVKQPALLLISLFIPAILFMESAQSQSAPPIKERSPFAPYQPEPKFAPARGGQTQSTGALTGALNDRAGTNGETSESAENQNSDQTSDQTNGQAPFSVTPDGVPALNIVPTVDRPPIPPPPDAAPLRPSGSGIARPAQAWRVKAFQLFKQKIDPNTTISILLNANYNNALLALRQTFEEEGLTVSGISVSSGHMLITLKSSASYSVNVGTTTSTNNSAGDNNNIRSERAIVALWPALSEAVLEIGSDTKTNTKTNTKPAAKGEAKTELRVMCESRNKSLTCLRVKDILNKLQNKFGDIKTDAETL